MNEAQQLTIYTASPRLNASGIIFMAEHGHAPNPEITYSPELPHASHVTVGLQARLLTGGEALLPGKTDLPRVTKQALEAGIGSSVAVEQGSLVEREKAYEHEDFEENKRVWSEQMQQRFTEHTSFWNGATGRAWKETFLRLGVNANNVDTDALYEQFFSDESTPSHEQFVNHVLSSYTNDQGVLQYDQLVKDKEALTWMAGMFGTNSSEIITELIHAKATLKTHPDAFVSAVNTAQNNTTRLNNLTPKETHLLTFLQNPEQNLEPYVPPQPRREPTPIRRPRSQQRTTEPVSRRRENEQTSQSEYYWDYVHADRNGVREFIGAADLPFLKDPETIAQLLQQKNPDHYRNIPLATLTEEIRLEQQELHTVLAEKGLNMEQLDAIAKKAIDNYEAFLQKTYGIIPPQIEHISIIPITGKTVEAFDKKNTGAFVMPHLPVIFLNVDNIAEHAQQLKKRNLHDLTPQEFVASMERLLNEINPHEYTHLIGDIAYWEYKKRDDDTSTHRIIGAKSGINVTKPPRANGEEVDVSTRRHRGDLLSEALTTELTNKWAASMGQELDANAYPNERKVLSALVKDLARTQQVSENEAFKQFAKAYFSATEFRHLAENLSAPHEIGLSNVKRIIRYGRPHLLSLVYGLMDYEHKKARAGEEPSYDLTLGFIQYRLNNTQNAEIQRSITTLPVSKTVKDYLQMVTAPRQQAA